MGGRVGRLRRLRKIGKIGKFKDLREGYCYLMLEVVRFGLSQKKIPSVAKGRERERH